jgi:hypothetical protein
MAKAGALLIAAGLACLGAALAVLWDDLRSPFAARLDVIDGGVIDGPQAAGPVPTTAPEGRSFAASAPPVAATPSPAKPTAVVVMLAPRNHEPVINPWTTTIAPHDRTTLVRELQRGLKRVGCYEGEINGVWTPQSRNAMRALADRVNATLPVDVPDDVLLALVEGQSGRVCGAPCPHGEDLAADGRCLPNALLARKAAPPRSIAAAKNGPPSVTSSMTTTTPAAPNAVAPPAPVGPGADQEGRMSLAGPIVGTPNPASPPEPAPRTAVQKPAAPSRTGAGPAIFKQFDRNGNF